MPQPLVSILINNYNYARFLGAAIDSALGQTYSNVEVIVVDDGSTDDSRELIRSYGESVRPILKSNGGQASAMNRGVEESRGEVLCFLDADDWFYPDKVAMIVEELKARTTRGAAHLMIGHTMDHVTGDGVRTGNRTIPLRTTDRASTTGELLDHGWFTARPVPSSAISITRVAAEEIFPLPESGVSVCSDVFVFTGAHLVGDVVGLDQSLGAYRVHEANRFYRRLNDPRTRDHYEALNDYVNGMIEAEGTTIDCFNSLYAAPYFLNHASRFESIRYTFRLLRRQRDRRALYAASLQLLHVAGLLPAMRKVKRMMER